MYVGMYVAHVIAPSLWFKQKMCSPDAATRRVSSPLDVARNLSWSLTTIILQPWYNSKAIV